MTAIFVLWQGDHLRLCETWDGDSFRDFGIPKSAYHETRLCRGHQFWRSERFPAWKLSCEQQVFFWTQKQYLGLHHFKIDFRDVCALLDFASLEKLFSNPISLIQELEVCELKCPEPVIETFRSRSGHREKSELGKPLPGLGLKRPTCNHGGVHSLWRSVQGPTAERRCGRRYTSEIYSSYIGTKFKSYLAVLIMAKVRNANRAIEPFFSHSTGIRPPIFVSQFSACFPHYFIVLGPWHSCNILLGPVSRRELAPPKQTDSALNGCGILRKRNEMSKVLIVLWLSLGKIASSGDILPQQNIHLSPGNLLPSVPAVPKMFAPQCYQSRILGSDIICQHAVGSIKFPSI